jgi:predicted nucleic-acid-binding Zn-ribbon protein
MKMKMNVLSFITVGLIIITLGCVEPEKKEITLGEIIFSPEPTTDRVDIVNKEYIKISCKTSNYKNNEIFYYTLDGSDPTEDSSSWNITDKIPQDFYFNDYIKNIKVLAVYNDNGRKIFKTGEANYNFKYFRSGSSSYSSPIEVKRDKGYYDYGYFKSPLGYDSDTSYFKPSQAGKFKIKVSLNLGGNLEISKNLVKIKEGTYYSETIDVEETDIIKIYIKQGSLYQLFAKDPHWKYEISLE